MARRPTLTPEETRNEQVIRTLYALADRKMKDTTQFVWPPSRASGTLVYPYANAKGHRHA